MSYSINNLELAVVQRMLRQRESEMDGLVERRDRLVISQSTFQSTETIAAQLAQVNLDLDQITAEIATMPEGVVKDRALLAQSKLNSQRLSLQIRLNNNEGDVVPDREYELAIVQFKISELSTFIAELQARRDELTG